MSIPPICMRGVDKENCLFYLYVQQIANLNNVIVRGPVTKNGIS
jgi:hypothetical protein